MISKFIKLPILACGLLMASSGFTQNSVTEDDELAQFLSLLEEQTTLATRTRMNADYVPGMISVIGTEEMYSRGFKTVWEALAMVPGVNLSMNATGMHSITVRGVGSIFEPGKVKLLLNGKSLNISASTAAGAIYDMPIQQVERIEFIRGPGSAIHGEFAFAGVLNVVTRRNSELYAVGVHSGNGYLVSGLNSFALAGGDLIANLNVAVSGSEGQDLDSGSDRSQGLTSGYAPGPINNKRDMASVVLDVSYDNFSAGVQFQQSNRGDYFGVNNLLPPDEKQTVISDSVLSIFAEQTISLDSSLVAEWSLNGLQNSLERNRLFLGSAEAFGGLVTEADVLADSLIEEARIEAKFSLQFSGEEHEIFSEFSVAEIRVTESEQYINLDPVTLLPTETTNEFNGPVDESLDRSSFSLVIQDQFHIDPKLTLTTGLRYDKYEDIDDNISPRIALVWRKSDRHIFKSQVARAFRPPSLVEVGGSIQSSINPETIDTIEFGHVYSSQKLTLRNTFYYSKLVDLITFQETAPFGYLNSGAENVRGYELELESAVTPDWQIQSSLTLQEDEVDQQSSALPWVFKFGAQYRLSSLHRFNGQLIGTSKKERASSDLREDFAQSIQVNLGFEKLNLVGVSGLSMRIGIDNVLGEEVRFIAPEDTYEDDYIFRDSPFLSVQVNYSR